MPIDYGAIARPTFANIIALSQNVYGYYNGGEYLEGQTRIFTHSEYIKVGTYVLPKPKTISPEYENAPCNLPAIYEAEELLKKLWPEAAFQMGMLIRRYYPLQLVTPKDYATEWGCVCGHDWDADPWSVYTSTYAVKGIAEGWVHEMFHNVLHYLGVHLLTWDDRMILNSTDMLYASPARKDILRPMGAVLQGMYSYIGVVEWEMRCFEAGDDKVKAQLEYNLGRLITGQQVIDANLEATKEGYEFWDSCDNWVYDLLGSADELGLKPTWSH